MGTRPLSEFPLENPCACCGRFNDIADFEFCSACCRAMANMECDAKLPGHVENLRGFIAQKLGIGTLPAVFIIWSELSLTHIMNHPVLLPTPVGYELIDMAKRGTELAKVQAQRVAKVMARVKTIKSIHRGKEEVAVEHY